MTFFFNGGVEEAWPGEDRVMVPSPKVATYDLQPKMNASGVAKEVGDTLLFLPPFSLSLSHFSPSI